MILWTKTIKTNIYINFAWSEKVCEAKVREQSNDEMCHCSAKKLMCQRNSLHVKLVREEWWEPLDEYERASLNIRWSLLIALYLIIYLPLYNIFSSAHLFFFISLALLIPNFWCGRNVSTQKPSFRAKAYSTIFNNSNSTFFFFEIL